MQSSAKMTKELASSRYDVSLALNKLGELIRERKEKSRAIENAELLNADEKLSQALESEFSSWKNFCDDVANALLKISLRIQDDGMRVSIEDLAIKTTSLQSKNEEFARKLTASLQQTDKLANDFAAKLSNLDEQFQEIRGQIDGLGQDLRELHQRVNSLENCNINVNGKITVLSRQKEIDQEELLHLSERVQALERQTTEQLQAQSPLDIVTVTLSAAVTVATVVGMVKLIGGEWKDWQPLVLPTSCYCGVFIGVWVALFVLRKYLRLL